jgi:carboxymethylenebutenolidase
MRYPFRYLAALLAATLLTASGWSLQSAGTADIPPGEAQAREHLNSSPRHGEWAMVQDGDDHIRAWIVYPERQQNAPVVLVIHEIYGLTDWIRSVADQLAAAGFIAVAPDLLSGKGPGGGGTESVDRDGAVGLVRGLQHGEVFRRLDASARHATSLPAARAEYGTIGFCWGGAISFAYATEQPRLGAAVVYYGTSPATESLEKIQAPVLGLYGSDDARVNATIPAADTEMKRLGKRYDHETYEGAGHGFLRAQDGRDGANLKAAQSAWKRTVAFLKTHLERRPPTGVVGRAD